MPESPRKEDTLITEADMEAEMEVESQVEAEAED